MPHVAERRTRKRNQAFRPQLSEPTGSDLGAAAMPVVAIGAGQQLAQAQVAGAVLAQQQQSVRLVAVLLVGDPNVAANDGFDARLTRRLIELDQTEDVGEVCER